jgi:hypothetical protein
MAVDVTRLSGAGQGLTDEQRARLTMLENTAGITGFQTGEAAYLAHIALGADRDRALAVSQRKTRK